MCAHPLSHQKNVSPIYLTFHHLLPVSFLLTPYPTLPYLILSYLILSYPTLPSISGLLYVDLAFDVQRSVWVEILMCLLPPSAAALVLREVGRRCLNKGL
jgi:hypothetical protein